MSRPNDIDRTSNADLVERIESERNAVTRSVLKDVAVRRLTASGTEINRLRALNAELEREVTRLRSDLEGMTAAAESLQADVYGVMERTE